MQSADAKEAAYELAVGACNADGAINELQKKLLAALAQSLNLAPDVLGKYRKEAEAVFRFARPSGAPATAANKLNGAEMDQMIRKAAIVMPHWN